MKIIVARVETKTFLINPSQRNRRPSNSGCIFIVRLFTNKRIQHGIPIVLFTKSSNGKVAFGLPFPIFG